MIIDDLNDDTFLMYAMKTYDTPYYIKSEFEEDLKRIKYIKKLFRRYKVKKLLKERLIINHLIMLYNVFGPEATTRILFFKINPKDYDILKTFLIYLNYMPENVRGINGQDIHSSDISIDLQIADVLRKI